MNCAECDYDLSGLGEPDRCPECGTRRWRARDEPGGWRLARRIFLHMALVPWFWLGSVHLLLVIARLQLGRWPARWGGDDPTEIPIVQLLHTPVSLVGVGATVALAASMGLCIAALTVRQVRKRWFRDERLSTVLAAGSWLLFFVLTRWDPAQALVWFFD